MSPQLVDLNALCLAQEQRIKALRTTDPAVKADAAHPPVKRAYVVGRCKVCRKQTRGYAYYCHDCADKRKTRFAETQHVALKGWR